MQTLYPSLVSRWTELAQGCGFMWGFQFRFQCGLDKAVNFIKNRLASRSHCWTKGQTGSSTRGRLTEMSTSCRHASFPAVLLGWCSIKNTVKAKGVGLAHVIQSNPVLTDLQEQRLKDLWIAYESWSKSWLKTTASETCRLKESLFSSCGRIRQKTRMLPFSSWEAQAELQSRQSKQKTLE